MKTFFYSICLVTSYVYLSGCATGNALKVNFDNYNFSTSYIQLPHHPLDTNYHTITVRVDTGVTSTLSAKNEELEERIQIPGWKKLRYDAHIQLNAKFENVLVEGSEVKEKVEIIKDKSGKDSLKKTNYYVQVQYSFASTARLKDYKEELIQEIVLGDRTQTRFYETSFFENIQEAKAFIKYALLPLTIELTKKSIDNAITDLNNNLSYNYGFVEQTVTDNFWVLNSKNHPEYEAHRQAYLNFKKSLAHLSSEGPVESVRIEMQPVIDYFNTLKKKYNSGEKSDRKLIYASCYNLSKIYYYLDQPEAAMNEANELQINGYDARDGRYLEMVASDLKNLLRQTKFTSRHIPINVDNYKGPEMVSRNGY